MVNPIQLRLYKVYTPLKIVNTGKDHNSYKILKNKNQIVGTFKFFDDGKIECLEIKEKFRRTKTSGFALLSIFDFCKKKGKEKKLDYLFCYGHKDNPNLVCKLYGKAGYTINGLITDKFIIPITEKGKQYIKELQDFYSGRTIEDFIKQVKNIINPPV